MSDQGNCSVDIEEIRRIGIVEYISKYADPECVSWIDAVNEKKEFL